MIRRSSSVENTIKQTGYASCLHALSQQDFISWPRGQIEVRMAVDGMVCPHWSLSSPPTPVLPWPSDVPHPGFLPLENAPMFSTNAHLPLESALNYLSWEKQSCKLVHMERLVMDNCLKTTSSWGSDQKPNEQNSSGGVWGIAERLVQDPFCCPSPYTMKGRSHRFWKR